MTVLFLAGAVIYITLQNQRVQTFLTTQLTSYFSKNYHITLHIEKVKFSLFNNVLLENVWLEDQEGDTLAGIKLVSARLSQFSLKKKHAEIGHVTLDRLRIFIKKDSSIVYNFSFLSDVFKKKSQDTPGIWSLSCENFRLKNSGFVYQTGTKPVNQYFAEEINFRIKDLIYTPDSLKFRLASLTLIDNRGFFLNDFSADFLSGKGKTIIDNIRFHTLNSSVEEATFILHQDTLPGNAEQTGHLELTVEKSGISLADVALFIPSLKGMDQELQISGRLTWNSGNLKAKNLLIATGNNTLVNCDMTVSFLEGVTEPFLFVDLNRSQADFDDLRHIKLPDASKVRYLSFPQNLLEAGIISYEGNFTGFPGDFVAYGTINSLMGEIKSDLSFVPGENDRIRFNGKLETSGFNLGKLLNSGQIGEISLDGMVNGMISKSAKNLGGTFKGAISRLEALGYEYQNIDLNGKINNRQFDGFANVDDPNLKLNFSGMLNLNKKVPLFDFVLNLKKANIVALHLDTLRTVSDLSFEMAANFTGSSLDNLDGLIQVYNGTYTNPNNSLSFKNLTVSTHLEEKNSRIHLNSDFLDGSLTGTYHFKSLFDSFRKVLAHFIPALGNYQELAINSNQFTFELTGKSLDEITSVFFPAWKISTPFRIKGHINSNLPTFEMNGTIPGVRFNQLLFRNIGIDIKPGENVLSSSVRLEEVEIGQGFGLSDLHLSADASSNQLSTDITWNNHEKRKNSGKIQSEIQFSRNGGSRFPRIAIRLKPSEIVVSDSVWRIPATTLVIDSTDISVNNLAFKNSQQELRADGRISTDKTAQLSLGFKGINLGSLGNYLNKPPGIKGMLNGTVGISDFYHQRLFTSDLRLEGFEFREDPVGDVTLVSQWDRNTELINSEIKIVRNDRNRLLGKGSFDPGTQNVDFVFDAENLSLGLLGTVIRETFSNFHGDGSGRVRLHGTPDKILLDGAVFCKNAGLTIDFSQVSYLISDSIRFAGDKIIFRNINIADFSGNKGIFNGFIRHDTFRNMDYDMTVTTGKILAMNTTLRDNENFFGKAIVRGNLTIKGHDSDVLMTGEATSLPETSVTIVLDDDAEVARYDFIRFIQPEKDTVAQSKPVQKPEEGGLEVNLLVHATPEARVQMIYNTQISDVIRAQGEGTLRFGMDKAGNISLSGNYNLEQGEYLFTLQDVIRKRFTVEKGSSITWSGDPYNAVLDLEAVYKLKASLYELLVGSKDNFKNTQRIPVDCMIMLTGDLMRPEISLDIVFPDIEERLRDELQQFFSTQEDKNRQMLSLLVLGKFYTPDYIRGSYEAGTMTTTLIGNTASDLLSNQLSNWLSQINQDVDVGFNYRPGNQLTDDEIELALSTQIFNDRVNINGNIGNNTRPNRTSNTELVGDFEIAVKLSQNGKLQLKVYNKSNNNLIYETAPYTQGLGFSYKEEYNTLGELWRQFSSLFRKK